MKQNKQNLIGSIDALKPERTEHLIKSVTAQRIQETQKIEQVRLIFTIYSFANTELQKNTIKYIKHSL